MQPVWEPPHPILKTEGGRFGRSVSRTIAKARLLAPCVCGDSGSCVYIFEAFVSLRPAMPKRIVYLCRGNRTWLLSQEIAEGEGVRSHFTAIKLPHDVDVETALRVVQAEFPDYDIRVLNWDRPKLDYAPPG